MTLEEMDALLSGFLEKMQNLPSPVVDLDVPYSTGLTKDKVNSGKVVVVGDTHGQLEDVLWMFFKYGNLEVLIFLSSNVVLQACAELTGCGFSETGLKFQRSTGAKQRIPL